MFYKIGPDKLLLYRTPPDNCLPFKDVLQNRSCQTPFVQNISGQLLLLFLINPYHQRQPDKKRYQISSSHFLLVINNTYEIAIIHDGHAVTNLTVSDRNMRK